MVRRIVIIFYCLAISFLTYAQADEAQSVADTLSLNADSRYDAPAIIFPGLVYGETDFTEYFNDRFNTLAETSKRQEFSFFPNNTTSHTLLYSYGGYGLSGFPGSYGGAVAMIPSVGSLYWVAGRNAFDIFNLYSSTSAYGGVGFILASGINLNAGGVVGASFLRDGCPVYQGGLQMSLVLHPNDNASVMIWGQYLKMNHMSPVPAVMPESFKRMSVGASAKFKVGNATFGVGASVSTY